MRFGPIQARSLTILGEILMQQYAQQEGIIGHSFSNFFLNSSTMTLGPWWSQLNQI